MVTLRSAMRRSEITKSSRWRPQPFVRRFAFRPSITTNEGATLSKLIACGALLLVIASMPTVSNAQPSISEPRTFRTSANNLSIPDSFRVDKRENRFFSRGGLGMGLGSSPKVNLETSAYQLAVYGTPDETTDANGNKTYVERIAFQLFIDTYVIDALGDPVRSVKEYLFSKKGSPVALRVPALGWSTKKGDVSQFWAAGEFNVGARLIPLNASDGESFKPTGSGTVSYTQQVSIDWKLNETPGNIFIELTPSYNFVIGDDLKAALAPVGGEQKAMEGGLDYRFGYKFGSTNPRAISITGTRSFRELRGTRNLLSLVFSAAP
jgi:hypothetical protein